MGNTQFEVKVPTNETKYEANVQTLTSIYGCILKQIDSKMIEGYEL